MSQENITVNKSKSTKASTVKDATVEKLKDNAKKLIEKSQADWYEIGDTLITIKSLVGHSKFSKWLDEEVDFSHNLANKYMRVAENYDKETAIKLGIRKAYLLLKIDEINREKFIDDNDAYNLSCVKLEELVKKLDTNKGASKSKNKGRFFVKNIDKFTKDLSNKIDEFIEYKSIAEADDLNIINNNKDIFDKLLELNDLIKLVKSKSDLSIESKPDEPNIQEVDTLTEYNLEYGKLDKDIEEYNDNGYYDPETNKYYSSNY